MKKKRFTEGPWFINGTDQILAGEKGSAKYIASAIGLNGGNNVRLAFIAASRDALSQENLDRAEASEAALQKAYKAIAKATAPQENPL